jgi:hypothetical protein
VYNVHNTAGLCGGVPLTKDQGKSTLLTASLTMAKMSMPIGREVAVPTVPRTRGLPVFFPSFHRYHIPLFVHPCLAGRASSGAVPRASSLGQGRPSSKRHHTSPDDVRNQITAEGLN